MINIYINNQLADFFGDLTIKKENSLFTKPDVEPSAHTYTLTLPITSTNVNIFSFIQYTLTPPTDLNARIDIDGLTIFEGSCRVTSISNSGYSVYFTEVIKGGEGVKKMLTDTITLRDIITIADRVDIEGSNGVYFDGMVGGYASAMYFNTTSNSLRWYDHIANLAFDVNYLINKIAQHYGISIAQLPSVYLTQLGKKDTFTKTINGISSFWVRPQSSIPRITPKDLLQNVAFALGRKMVIDYNTNTITFASLNEVKSIGKVFSEPFDTINYHDGINGKITFTEIEPYTYTRNKGEKNEYEVSVAYSDDFSAVIGNGDTSLFKNKLSVPTIYNGYAVLPSEFDENDKRLKNIALVQFVLDGQTSHYIPFDPKEYIEHGLYGKINDKKTLVKFSTKLSPIDYLSLDMARSILAYGHQAYIKTLNYKTSGETDIEAYLY